MHYAHHDRRVILSSSTTSGETKIRLQALKNNLGSMTSFFLVFVFCERKDVTSSNDYVIVSCVHVHHQLINLSPSQLVTVSAQQCQCQWPWWQLCQGDKLFVQS